MQLDKLVIAIRARSGWSAIDLGIVFARGFWLRGVLLYLLMAAPVFALTMLIPETSAVFSYFVLWWCKPLFERPILYFLSRELFNEPVGFWKTLRCWREWVWPSLGWILTIRRLSVSRAMYAPVSLLEAPTSGEYSQRVTVLGRNYANESTWLTLVFYHLESFLWISLLVVAAVFFPDQIESGVMRLIELREGDTGYLVFSVLLTMAMVAPFYTAAGFILYISRRVELEGWDIEMCFRDWMSDFNPSPAQRVSQDSVSL